MHDPPQLPLATVGPDGRVSYAEHAAELTLAVPEGWLAPTPEGDAVAVTLSFRVRVATSEDDRRAFRQMLLQGRSVVHLADVIAACLARLEPAARATASAPAEAWLQADSALTDPLRRAISATAYVCGLEIVSDLIHLRAQVPAYTLRQAENRRRQLLADAEARRLASARHAATLLRELSDRRQSAAGLLSRLPAEDAQAVLLAALGHEHPAPAGGKTVLWCAAGSCLVGITPPADDGRLPDPAVHPIPTRLGPVRSVFANPGELLIGARDGVWLLHRPATAASTSDLDPAGFVPLFDDPMPAEHGFSAVVRSGELIFAAHRQRGLVWWQLGRSATPLGSIRPKAGPDRPPAAPSTPPPPAATGLPPAAGATPPLPPVIPGVFTALCPAPDGLGVLAASDHLHRIGPDGTREPIHPLASRCLLLTEADGLLACVTESGTVLLLDRQTLRPTGELAIGEPISSAGPMPWSGGTRLLCATQSGGMVAVGVADPVVLRYASAHRGLREVAAGSGVVAAVSPDRMRLVLWHAWEPRRPVAEVHIGALVRGRIADVCAVC